MEYLDPLREAWERGKRDAEDNVSGNTLNDNPCPFEPGRYRDSRWYWWRKGFLGEPWEDE